MPRRRSGRSQWFPPPSRPRRVDGGIRARSRRGAVGDTWWSRRFLELLESFGIGARLDRGKRYARQGQVLSLDVELGVVTALVQGSRARPYRVRIRVPTLSEADWRRAEAAMVQRASFLAVLLAGEMPRDIADAFEGCAGSLFPARMAELRGDCSCPDWADVCKHLAAVYFLLAEALDDNPFLLFRWRGRDREALLANLRALRGDAAAAVGDDDQWAGVLAVETIDLGGNLGGFWDTAGPLGGLDGATLTAARAFAADALLLGLDPLERTVAGTPLGELLRPAYTQIAAAARVRLLQD